MNNNRNNRRRGRGNRNQGGANNQNRIDSRARGNAPQLLDKYKKLAQDAQHNGDRVQAEYYLQFADHYFRVIADNKARQEEARAKRNEGRDQSSDDGEDGEETEGRRGDNRRNNRRGRNRREDGDIIEKEGEAGVEGEMADQDMERAEDTGESDESERKPRRRRSAKDDDRAPRARKPRERKARDEDGGEIDSSVLPPSIGGEASSGNDDGDALVAVS